MSLNLHAGNNDNLLVNSVRNICQGVLLAFDAMITVS